MTNPHTELKALTGWEYDAGDRFSTDFLLGKLPEKAQCLYPRNRSQYLNLKRDRYGFTALYIGSYHASAPTPSDALCKLAITLKKEGVI